MMEDVPYSSDMSYADLLRMAIKNEEKLRTSLYLDGQVDHGPFLEKTAPDPCPRGNEA